jgi:CyaY protein
LVRAQFWPIIATRMPDPDQDFLQQAEVCMRGLLADLDAFDPDELEADWASGVLKISFPDGRNCILNRQSAANQIWLAEGASAWHFVQDRDGRWVDTKGRGELRPILAEVLSKRLRRPIRL